MSEGRNRKWIAGHALAWMIGLAVVVQGAAAVCQAQTQPQAAANPAPAEPHRGGGGMHEGITVHGHWVIEVRNPDGTATARREFENQIQNQGMVFLSALIAGNNSSGGLSVLLNGAATSYTEIAGLGTAAFLTFSEAGPCAPLTTLIATAGQPNGTTCLITTGVNPKGYASFLSYLCLANQAEGTGVFPTGQTYPCSTNLAVTAPTYSEGPLPGAGITLQGSVTVTAVSGGNVNDVETVFTSCDANSTPGNCLTSYTTQNGGAPNSNANVTGYSVFTQRNLDGQNGDPPAVPYSPGQTISVTVTFSFQ
jgi:hypothetical protein